MQQEQWRPVPGLERLYEVSNIGNVRSLTIGATHAPRKEPHLLAKMKDERGYYRVSINNRKIRIHKLVALSFLGPRPDKMEVCHIDGDKLNNRVENLRYDTHASNMRDRQNHGGTARGLRNGKSKLSPDQVAHIASEIKAGKSLTQIGKHLRVSSGTIYAIRNGITWAHITGFQRIK